MGYRLGVDVGGTFTDVQMQDTASGELTLVKVLSTPEDQSVGVLAGIEEACQRVGATPKDLDQILHGSTVVTNLILESKGAKGGLLTTKGNEQILHLARAWTPGPLYGWMGMIKPPPLVELWNTRGIGGRLAADGSIVEELDEAEVRAAVDELVADGVQSVTVGFLNSYVNPEHERRARDIAREAHPELPISISSDLRSRVPRVRAHAHRRAERTTRSRMVIRYVDGLERLLRERRLRQRLGIVRSDGGTMSRCPPRSARWTPPSPDRPGAWSARPTWPAASAPRTCSRSTWAAPPPTCRCAWTAP